MTDRGGPSGPLTLTASALDARSFAAFGRVADLSGGRPVNQGRGRRTDLCAALQHDGVASSPALALYRMQASVLPFRVSLFERHLHTEQLFAPLAGARFLVVVAPDGPDGGPAVEQARAFVGDAHQQVVYGQGVWHVPLVALGGEASFVMAMWETGGPEDCQEWSVSENLLVAGAAEPDSAKA